MYGEKLSRAGLGKAGAEAEHLQVWIDRWAATATSSDHSKQHLVASTGRFRFDLSVTTEKPPIVHGTEGISRKGDVGGQASHYYSLTRLATTGTMTVDGKTYPVAGMSWMDHEFGSADLGEGLTGWDWFSVQLDNRTEVMLYLLRNAEGLPDPASSGTLVLADGRGQHLTISDFRVEALDHWKSPASGARYPSRWRLTIPAQRISLELTPLLADQELRTKRSTQVTYWEGAVAIRGQVGDDGVGGQGYVELTGYGEPFRQKL
jgi:predicted secreted hydrolase